MEHESFEDEQVAKLMNDNFVSIKVDREEMPEIDHLYMSVCQAMTEEVGGLTIVMSPEKEPFLQEPISQKLVKETDPECLNLFPL